MNVVVNRLVHSDTFINNGALPVKVRLLNRQRLYAGYLTDLVRVYHDIAELGCRTTNCLQDYSREPRVRWSQDESTIK